MTKQQELTHRQQEVFQYIKQEIQQKGYPPTVREICEAVGLHSPSTVHAHLKALEEKGLLKRNAAKPRAMEIINLQQYQKEQQGEMFEQKEMAQIPIIGTITAGVPILAEEQIEDVFPVPLDFLHSNQPLFMLKVSGESMIEAGILDGDYIIVEKTPVVHNGEIAAVLIEDSATVKYFYKEKNYIRLEPANSSMHSIIVADAQILGRVIGLFRRF